MVSWLHLLYQHDISDLPVEIRLPRLVVPVVNLWPNSEITRVRNADQGFWKITPNLTILINGQHG